MWAQISISSTKPELHRACGAAWSLAWPVVLKNWAELERQNPKLNRLSGWEAGAAPGRNGKFVGSKGSHQANKQRPWLTTKSGGWKGYLQKPHETTMEGATRIAISSPTATGRGNTGTQQANPLRNRRHRSEDGNRTQSRYKILAAMFHPKPPDTQRKRDISRETHQEDLVIGFSSHHIKTTAINYVKEL